MDTARLRRELGSSFRLLVTEERWMFGGLVAGLVAYGLWVGATGAALHYGLEFAGRPITVSPWTTLTTAVFGVVVVLWVAVPALLGTALIDRYLTNVSGNLRQYYRVQHPSTLVVAPVVMFGLGAAAGVVSGGFAAPLLAALAVIGLVVLVRALAYSHRVFSLSVPRILQGCVAVSLGVLAIGVLVAGATVAGRTGFVASAAAGIGELLGVAGLGGMLLGGTQVGSLSVPTLPAVAAGLPVTLAVVYLLVQSLAGLVTRGLGVTVPRSQLRTGQRYPEFARPTTGVQVEPATETDDPGRSDGSESAADGGERTTPGAGDAGTSADTDSSQPTGEQETAEAAGSEDGTRSHGNTRVFTPPEDGDFDDAVPDATTGDGAAGTDVSVAAPAASEADGDADSPVDDGYWCPSCNDEFPTGANFAYCPTCGAELEPK